MKRNHYLILGGLGLAAVAYLGYRYYKKGSIFGKSNMSGEYYESLRNLPEQYISDRDSMSNFQGTSCKCDNGFTGWCQSGDCTKCCGSYNDKKMPVERRHYKF